MGGGGGKSVTRSAHRAFCPPPFKEHPGHRSGYLLPTEAGAMDQLSMQLRTGTADMHLPPRATGWGHKSKTTVALGRVTDALWPKKMRKLTVICTVHLLIVRV